MKISRISYLIFIILLLASCTRENKITNTKEIFVLPFNDKFIIAKEDKEDITLLDTIKLANFDIENNDFTLDRNEKPKAIIIDNKYAGIIGNENFYLYDLNLKKVKSFPLNFKPTSINSCKNIVYVGGKSERHDEGEIFAILNLNPNHPKFNSLKLPIDISYGKSIDDILILNNKLILVDNIIYPKYLIEYDIKMPGKPIHTKTKELKNNGTYEHIVKADINKDWMVLLSTTVGRMGSGSHITIDGKKKGHLSTFSSFHMTNENSDEFEDTFSDICLIENVLYLIKGKELYHLNLNKSIKVGNLKKIETMKNLESIIKTPSNRLIVVGNNTFDLIK